MEPSPPRPPVLVTGGTGYIGSHLVPELLRTGHRVRVLTRGRSRLSRFPWQDAVEVVEGDVADEPALACALEGVRLAYYLVHSLETTRTGYRARDTTLATRFGQAARVRGVRHIVYLGGLSKPGQRLSEHLLSRQETGAALASSGVSVTELRAGPVIGSGSLPFEMIRYLTERLPIMICPRWVYTKVQPIGIRDVIGYLAAASHLESSTSRLVEIAGPDVMSYGEMMTRYANVRGLKRLMIRVPFLTPRLSSLWVGWVTPLHTNAARELVDGLRTEVVVSSTDAKVLFPTVVPMTYEAAVAEALSETVPGSIITTSGPAAAVSGHRNVRVARGSSQGLVFERRDLRTAASPGDVFLTFAGLGGETGWLFMDWMWRLRGAIDRALGGIGLRRQAPMTGALAVGDRLDSWVVEAIETDRRLLLRSEMKLPGRAWIEFRCAPMEDGSTTFSLCNYFAPKGLPGFLYCGVMRPIDSRLFTGMARSIVAQAESRSRR